MQGKDTKQEEFIRQLTDGQSSLWAYVFSLLPDHAAAQDVLQQTNLTLWRKADDFQPGSSYFAWASKAAYFHVLTYRRGMRRDRLVFSDEVFAYLAERQAERLADAPSERVTALRGCLDKLPPHSRKLLECRYTPGASVKNLAETDGRSTAALSQVLYRIRETLLSCIERSMTVGGTA